MRRLLVLIASALVLPTVQAHGNATDGWSHLSVDVQSLGPGENRTYHLTPGEDVGMAADGMFRVDWIFIAFAGINGTATLRAQLINEGVTVQNWTWAPEAWHKNTTRLPFDGAYELTITNPGTEGTSQYAFYFDQSCNCAGKLIALPGGFVIFNYDLPKGREAKIGFPLIPEWEAKGIVATQTGNDGHWPQDFRVITESQARGPAWLNLSFTPTETGRHYVFVEAIDGASPERPLHLTPLVEVEPESTPAPPFASVLTLTIFWLALRRVQRGRD